MILVTGSAGLVGRHLCAHLQRAGHDVRYFDLKRSSSEDVREIEAVEQALSGVTGIVHLAAVARVLYGERDPVLCRSTNIGGLKTVLGAALRISTVRPWFIFASSREVYGDAARVPVTEDTELCALNNYARTKVEGEALVNAAREAGLIANICRLSTVYGSVEDYADRVLPAFCAAAAMGGEIYIEGQDVTLDPTHVDDVSRGLRLLIEQTSLQNLLPPIHFVSGRGRTLAELAQLAIAAGESRTNVSTRPYRKYDVKKFVGDPGRAKALLGWTTQIDIEDGIARLVQDFRDLHLSAQKHKEAARPMGLSADFR